MASCELTISLADFGLDPIEGAQVSAQGADGHVFRDGKWLIGVSETAETDANGLAVLTVPQITNMVIRASIGSARPVSVRVTTPASAAATLADIVGEAAPSGQAFSAAVYDSVKALIAAGSNIILTADDTTGTLTLSASGTLSGSVAWQDVTGKPTAFTPSAHTHAIADVTGLQAALDAAGGGSVAWADVTDKPTFATVATTGAYSDLSGLPALGTAASTDATAYATAAQGALADSAVQTADLATVATTGAYTDLIGLPTLFSGAYADLTGAPDLSGLAPLASPALTGAPTAPTATAGTNTTQIATTAFVQAAVVAAGGGDMLAAVYDSNADGKVDAADTADAAPWAGITGKPATFPPDTHTHAYDDLTGLPTLGTAAATDATAYATAAQGALADSAVQPADLATVATSGAYADLSGVPTLGTAAATDATAYATAAQGALADTAVQPAAIAGMVQSTTITHVERKTQAEYDALGTPDASTVYIIVG